MHLAKLPTENAPFDADHLPIGLTYKWREVSGIKENDTQPVRGFLEMEF